MIRIYFYIVILYLLNGFFALAFPFFTTVSTYMIPLSYNNLLPKAPLTVLTLLVFDRIRGINFLKLQQQKVSHTSSFFVYSTDQISAVITQLIEQLAA
jgi:hypothetical protein